ncbi:PREDICTED: uncharacterized protein LOC107352252 [Acropora digitifera]|uniref:uncharacterized protein LOC107352252 n=1 Tax=Acropora digitifera TaxID=70779 RepID=UPI00077AFB32|nr:PREDICTED: uncharacterized protein LOC107352252 [Acropora digitifera]
MAPWVTFIYVLTLSIHQLNEAKVVHRIEVDAGRYSQTQLKDESDNTRSKYMALVSPVGEEKSRSDEKGVRKDVFDFNGILKESEKCGHGSWCQEKAKVNEDKNPKERPKNDGENSPKNSDVSGKLKEIRYFCPIGLWCINEVRRGYENSHSLRQCPPGLWCKRNRMMGTVKDLLRNQAKRREVERADTIHDGPRNCPPGLWCKRNRILTTTDKTLCPEGYQCSSKRGVGFETSSTIQNCPPGLWCKRDAVLAKERAINHDVTRCTTDGLKCYDQPLNKDSRGLLKDQSINRKENDHNCSSGTWCSVKRDVAGTVHTTPLRNCPPGLWCKRNSKNTP